MALCLASSLISCGKFNIYNQLVRYKWWFRNGYMSSTGECFDIGAATRVALCKFENQQKSFAKQQGYKVDAIDNLVSDEVDSMPIWNCGKSDAAGNGSLMRLAPVPLFFHYDPALAVHYSGRSSLSTHGDIRAIDACRFYGALISGALNGVPKSEILSPLFLRKYASWFGNQRLCPDVIHIANGSYHTKQRGYIDGIRGKGYVIDSLEAALWAFSNDNNSFEQGVLLAVNLGDDADTTAAIYGQLAGAFYGYANLPPKWKDRIYSRDFLIQISEWIAYRGYCWHYSRTKQIYSQT